MRVHIIAKGRVQGVGFRVSAWQKAIECDLKGYVRNLPNGDVELEVEGSESNIEAFIKELEAGLNRFIRIDDLKWKNWKRREDIRILGWNDRSS